LSDREELTPIEWAASGTPDPDQPDQPPAGAWLDSYHDLKATGLHWKKAAFAAWFNAPKAARQPKTMRELAMLLNYASEQVFYKWQRQPWFAAAGIDKLRQAIFQRFIGDVDRKTIAGALTESGTPGVAARRLFYEQAKLAMPIELDLSVDSTFEQALRRAYGKDDNGDDSETQSDP
jgi:hypothetical protein